MSGAYPPDQRGERQSVGVLPARPDSGWYAGVQLPSWAQAKPATPPPAPRPTPPAPEPASGDAERPSGWARIISADRIITLVFFIAALILNFYLVSTTSLYFDESMSVETARLDPGLLIQYLWGNQNQMILYYALLSAWIHLLGALGITASDLLVRLPSVILAATNTSVIYLLGRRLWNRTTGMAAAALLMLSPLQLYHAQKARAYPLELLTLTVAWFALFLIISGKDQRKRVWAMFIAGVTLAAYSQPFSALVVVAMGLAFLWYLVVPGRWRASTRAALRGAFISVGIITVLIVPLGADFALNGQPNDFVAPARLSDFFNLFIRIQVDAPHKTAVNFVVALALFGALGVAVTALWNIPRLAAWLRHLQAGQGVSATLARAVTPLPPGSAALILWVLTPMVIAFAVTQPYLNLHLFYWRYLVVIVPPLCLLMGIGASTIRVPFGLAPSPRGAPILLVVLYLVIVALVVPETASYYANAEVEDFYTPTAWVNAHYQAGDGLVCLPGRMCSAPVEYYSLTNPGALRIEPSFPGAWLWAEQRQTRTDPAYVEMYAAQQNRVFLVDAPFGMSATQLADSNQIIAWFNSHEHMIGACQALNVTVRLYEQGTPNPSRDNNKKALCKDVFLSQ